MSFKHPLARVKGLGASGDGSHHWWLQRVTALALIPLSLWFVFALFSHMGDSHAEMINWMSHPIVSAMLILYLVFMFFHAQLGLQVVVEDYVHHEGLRLATMLLIKGIILLVGLVSILAVLRVAL